MAERILVVGAGPTGLTAAVELRRLGFDAVVVDRKPAPSPLSRAVGILPRSMEILSPSGAAAAIAAEAVAIERAYAHLGARRIGGFRITERTGQRLFALAQDRTEAHLAEALGRYGGAVRFGEPFETLEQDEAGVTARIAGRDERFDRVIGADGVHSTVREALGLAFPGHDLPETWSVADVDAEGWRDPATFQIFLIENGGGVIVVPLERARFRVFSNRPDGLAVLPVPMQVTRVRRADTFRISVRQVERYQVGRVYLAGDAAHCHSPVGGRGMNLGIADAGDLAGRLAAGDTSGYQAARHAAGAETIRLSEGVRRAILVPHRGRDLLVRTVFGLVTRIPALETLAARRLLSM